MRLQPKMTDLPPVAERKTLRETFGLTQQELADYLGIGLSTVYAWESGRNEPRGEKRKKYLAFCIAAKELLTENKKGGKANGDSETD